MNKFIISLFFLPLFACSNVVDSYQPRFFPTSFVGLTTDEVVDYQNVQLDYDLTSSDE